MPTHMSDTLIKLHQPKPVLHIHYMTKKSYSCVNLFNALYFKVRFPKARHKRVPFQGYHNTQSNLDRLHQEYIS